MHSLGIRHARAEVKNISSRKKDAALKNSDPPHAPISHDSVVRQRSHAPSPRRRSAHRRENDLRSRTYSESDLALLVNDRLQRAVLTVTTDIGKSVADISYCLATWLIRERNSVIIIEWDLSRYRGNEAGRVLTAYGTFSNLERLSEYNNYSEDYD